ncbi:MAG: hypothetical protein NTV21_19985 [Planctomycetota bacterium]|nr:hypothetical protein [Planctomycetota bacterium]
MSVLTVYNHGTCSSSTDGFDKLEIVTCFGNLHRKFDPGGERIHWYITEGVGSKLDPVTHGRLVFDERRMILYPAKPSSSWFFGGTRHATSGDGVQQNVQNFLTLLTFLKASNRVPEAINMVGWSRGAVTCIRQASELWRDGTLGLSSIPIHIFAVDPVAGASADLERQGSILYPNVHDFIACLAQGERRSTFAPKSPTKLKVASPSQTHTAFLNFPGIHSDVAKLSGEPGIITFDLCARFLHHHGTVVPAHSGFLSAPLRLLQAYFNLALRNKRIGTRVLTGSKATSHTGWIDRNTGTADRVMSLGVFEPRHLHDDQVSDPDLFVNVHHEALFEHHYPDLYDLLFHRRLSPFELDQALSSPVIAQRLRHLDLYSPGIAAELSRPGRFAHAAPSRSWLTTLIANHLVA